jgi:hypothetical protein
MVFALARVTKAVWEYRDHLIMSDEAGTLSMNLNLISSGVFRIGTPVSSVNYNENFPPRWEPILWVVESVLRLPFDAIGFAVGDERVSEIAPTFYLVLLLILFTPFLLKEGSEEYAVVVSYAVAILSFTTVIVHAFFRIRYFPFSIMGNFLSAIVFSHYYSKGQLTLRQLTLMLVCCIIPITFHVLGVFLSFPMALALLWKLKTHIRFFYNKIIAERLLLKICMVAGLILICIVAIEMLRYRIAPYYGIRKSENFSIEYSYRFVKHILGPDAIPMVINCIIIVFVYCQRKRLGSFISVLFGINAGCIFFSILVAIISQATNFRAQRYSLAPYVSWTIIYGIFAWAVLHFLPLRMQRAGGYKKNIVTSIAMTLVLAYGYIIAEDKPFGTWELPLYTSLSDYCPPLSSAIDRGDITPDKLIILSHEPSYFMHHFFDSRIYMTRWHPEMACGETIWSARDNRYYYRSEKGWIYEHNNYPLLFDKYDILRLFEEIQNPSDTWIAFLSVRWETFDPASEKLWTYLKENFPNDGTPILAQTILDAIERTLQINVKIK